jgi:hypothetical protein
MSEKYSVIKSKYILAIALTIILLLGAMMVVYSFYRRGGMGPEQPVHFSHRVHVTDKKISCFMCHEGAADTKMAGIPPMQTCMLCHSRIIPQHPEIQKVRKSFDMNIPVYWNKVGERLPGYVFFNHAVHIAKKIDCSACHGNVNEMDRVKTVNDFDMNFCVKCHQENKASIDCYTCHR